VFVLGKMFSCFHLVGLSVWPIVFSFRVGGFLLSVVFWLNVFSFDVFFLFGFGYVFVLVFWLINVVYEFGLGWGVKSVVVGLCVGVGLFIISEVMFFFGFF
jgi:Cytochrome c oxidase subunit III